MFIVIVIKRALFPQRIHHPSLDWAQPRYVRMAGNGDRGARILRDSPASVGPAKSYVSEHDDEGHVGALRSGSRPQIAL
jgi:hypothetical protein